MDIYKIPKFLETILNHLNNAWAKKEITRICSEQISHTHALHQTQELDSFFGEFSQTFTE